MKAVEKRDHGGGLDAAIREFGGEKSNWIDLSTGINPVGYPVAGLTPTDWAALPDQCAQDNLIAAAKEFWNIPANVSVVATPGLSAAIAKLPNVMPGRNVNIPGPTYNEYDAAYSVAGWTKDASRADATIVVHPNNPDGRIWKQSEFPDTLTVIDESFCDVVPDRSFVNLLPDTNRLILKSFGKFWGLAGLRLGFAIGGAGTIEKLTQNLGPWPVSGPALRIGARALRDIEWANTTRARLKEDSNRLDNLLTGQGAKIVGGTTLFRLYQVTGATDWQAKLARAHIWTRVFPYSDSWLRLGIPGPTHWDRLERAF